jgi:hypothetical protein
MSSAYVWVCVRCRSWGEKKFPLASTKWRKTLQIYMHITHFRTAKWIRILYNFECDSHMNEKEKRVVCVCISISSDWLAQSCVRTKKTEFFSNKSISRLNWRWTSECGELRRLSDSISLCHKMHSSCIAILLLVERGKWNSGINFSHHFTR